MEYHREGYTCFDAANQATSWFWEVYRRISKNKAWQCVVISGNKSTAYYHALFSVYQPLVLLRGRCGIKIENFLHILQNHIHHRFQIAFIILKQHMILLEFTFLKWILQPKLHLLHWRITDNETVQHQMSYTLPSSRKFSANIQLFHENNA